MFGRGTVLATATIGFVASQGNDGDRCFVTLSPSGEIPVRDLLSLALGYVVKISPNFGASVTGTGFWMELGAGDCSSIGPRNLVVSPEPGAAMRTYRAELREKRGRRFVLSPYEGRGREEHFAPRAAFALLRTVSERLEDKAYLLDAGVSLLVHADRTGVFDRTRLRDLGRATAVAEEIIAQVVSLPPPPGRDVPGAQPAPPTGGGAAGETPSGVAGGSSRRDVEAETSSGDDDGFDLAEHEAACRRVRFRLVEALEAAGWDVGLQDGTVVLGDGALFLDVPMEHVVRLLRADRLTRLRCGGAR